MTPPAAARARRRAGRLAAALPALGLVLVLGACDIGVGGGDPTPSPTPTLEASVPAFEAFSGLTVPEQAREVKVSTTPGPGGAPAYRVDFTLPSKAVDRFCTDGRLGQPLDVYTVPPYIRERFGFTDEDPSGVKIAEGALPGRMSVQRTVLATGTETATADVRVHVYELPR